MRGHDHIVHGQQRVVCLWQVPLKHVQRRAPQVSLLKRFDQGGFVNHLAATGVNQKRTGLHQRQTAGVYGVAGFVIAGQMEREEIRGGNDLVHVRREVSKVGLLLFGDVAVIAEHLHSKAVAGHSGHLRSDVSHADDAQCLPADIVAIQAAHRHVAAFQSVIVDDGVLCQHQDQTHGVLRHGFLVGFCCVANLDSQIGCGINVDAVHADSVHRHHFQLGAAFKDPLRKFSVSGECAIAVAALFEQRLFVRTGSRNQGISLFS